MARFQGASFPLIFFLLISWINQGWAQSDCPNIEDIQPCYCIGSAEGYKTIVCHGLEDQHQLQNITANLKGMIIDRFLILGSFNELQYVEIDDYYYTTTRRNDINPWFRYSPTPRYPYVTRNPYGTKTIRTVVPEELPSTWLQSVRLLSLEINNSSLSNSFLRNDPFKKQEEFLLSLTITHSLQNESYLGSLNDTNDNATHVSLVNLGRMKKLITIDLSYNHITAVYEDAFPSTLTSLERIVLSHNEIELIEDGAFRGLSSLCHLDLSHNKLLNVHYSSFSSLDKSLRLLDISWNFIEVLPDDLFDKMEVLEDIRFSYNNLEVLPEPTFSGLLKEVSLNVRGNFIICDCRLSWILRKSFRIIGTCASPKEVAFHEINKKLPFLRKC